MRNDQFYAIYFGILAIMITLQWHMMSICDNLKEIKKLLEKKHYSSQDATYEESQKMIGFLYRKGFSLDKIYKAVETRPW